MSPVRQHVLLCSQQFRRWQHHVITSARAFCHGEMASAIICTVNWVTMLNSFRSMASSLMFDRQYICLS